MEEEKKELEAPEELNQPVDEPQVEEKPIVEPKQSESIFRWQPVANENVDDKPDDVDAIKRSNEELKTKLELLNKRYEELENNRLLSAFDTADKSSNNIAIEKLEQLSDKDIIKMFTGGWVIICFLLLVKNKIVHRPSVEFYYFSDTRVRIVLWNFITI